ncbi:helix-turn-helix domain-containing protein [Aquimarina gracilis]|uniref:Helix-turn-helix domain-containing protein n=1 Tax=Aquimarina gracilis TaxID=874422 RepID=A0ABU5ZZP2_9FLAO|nr:helix-turn-helix domain-containing protein [Aquimarina gracilis]MEB3347285.1 helix-turn-helix domain-containing protein [Aquimarina gracilis]
MGGVNIRFLVGYLGLFLWILPYQNITAQENTIEQAEELYKEAKSLYFAEDYKKSIELFNKVEAIGRELKDDMLVCMATNMKGNSYVMNDQNQKALDAYYESLQIARNLNNFERELITGTGLVLVYKKTNQYEKALKLSQKMLQSVDGTSFKDTRTHVSVITTGIEVYLDTEQYDSVMHYADQGIALSKELEYKEGLIDLNIKKAVVYYNREQHKASLDYLFKAEELLQNHDIKNRFYPTVNASYFVASNYYQQGLYTKAIKRLQSNIDNSKGNDLFKLPVLQSHLLLANCYGKQGDFEKALYWNNKYMMLSEDFQKRKDKIINRIYEKEAQILKGSIANLQSEQEKSERVKKYAYIIATILFLIVLLGSLFYSKKQRSNKVLFNDLVQKINTLEAKEQKIVDKKETTKAIVIDDDKVHEVLKGLSKLETQEFYLRSDCSLRLVAKKVKTNATYLSKIINIHREKNFNEYINDLRIDYVLKRIKNDKKFRSFSVKSIATEIGYKSDYSFAKHFKAKTGLNPSYYIKNIQKQEKTLESVA